MANIRSKRTKPEMYIRSQLFRKGLRFRVNYSKCIGKPDLYFSKYRTAVFVNGCFWHHHEGCKYAYLPKSNTEYWNRKLNGNQMRDIKVLKTLGEHKIRALIIWECTINKMMKDEVFAEEILERLIEFIKNNQLNFFEI